MSLHTCFYNSVLKEFSTSCVISQMGLLEAYTQFLPDFILCTFPFAHFTLYPFTVTNYSHMTNVLGILLGNDRPGGCLRDPQCTKLGQHGP